MFNEKSCGNCIKSWSKCSMWICTILICLAGIIAVCRVIATTQKKIQILETAREQVLSSPREGEEIRQTRLDYDLEYDSEIQAVKNEAIKPIILILIIVGGQMTYNFTEHNTYY